MAQIISRIRYSNGLELLTLYCILKKEGHEFGTHTGTPSQVDYGPLGASFPEKDGHVPLAHRESILRRRRGFGRPSSLDVVFYGVPESAFRFFSQAGLVCSFCL